MSDAATTLPVAARALFVGAGIDLAQFDAEIQLARREQSRDEEEAA